MTRPSVWVLACLLAACASVPPVPSASAEQRWRERKAVLESMRVWALNGRIALNTQDDAWQANIYWQQRGDTFEIRLNAPLGAGAMALYGDKRGIVMRLPEGKTVTAQDAESLLHEHLGWRIPLAGLHYWVRGLPQPGAPYHSELDAEGRLTELRQAGWQIKFLRYVEAIPVQLPDKIFLEHPQLHARLVIQQWMPV